MIRFSARDAYLLLLPEERALIRNRALISFMRNSSIVCQRSFDVHLIEDQKDCKADLLSFMFLYRPVPFIRIVWKAQLHIKANKPAELC